MKPYRIGVVPYLNSRPLIHGLAEKGHELVFEVPSLLQQMLREGHLDVGIVSSFETFTIDDLTIVPDVCIASEGAVRSIKLFSKLPFQAVEKVALDTSSRTSNALVQIILEQKYRATPAFIPFPPDLNQMLQHNDAGLLIGDPCMRQNGKGLRETDLGDEWLRMTGLPFVYAVWAARRGADLGDLPAQLREARDAGRAHPDEVLDLTPKLPVSREASEDYLRNVMKYTLGEREMAGLKKFQEISARMGLICCARELDIYDG